MSEGIILQITISLCKHSLYGTSSLASDYVEDVVFSTMKEHYLFCHLLDVLYGLHYLTTLGSIDQPVHSH